MGTIWRERETVGVHDREVEAETYPRRVNQQPQLNQLQPSSPAESSTPIADPLSFPELQSTQVLSMYNR